MSLRSPWYVRPLLLMLSKDHKTPYSLHHRSWACPCYSLPISKTALKASLLRKSATTTKSGTGTNWKVQGGVMGRRWTCSIVPSASLAWTLWVSRPSKGMSIVRPPTECFLTDQPTELGFAQP